MTILTRNQILTAPDLQRELVHVPEWGGDVYVRGLTGSERDALEAGMLERKGKTTSIRLENLRARLLSTTLVDEDGKSLFGPEDVVVLGSKSAVALERCFAVARRLSGFTEQDVEELTKN